MVKSDILDGYFGIYYIIILNDSKEDVKGHKNILIKKLTKDNNELLGFMENISQNESLPSFQWKSKIKMKLKYLLSENKFYV
jgi:hypothetical protein